MDQATAPGQGKGRTGRRVAAVALLLVVGVVVLVLILGPLVTSPSRRIFVTRNAACLQCHTELLSALRDRSVHDPFLGRHCTSCHTPHGASVSYFDQPLRSPPSVLQALLSGWPRLAAKVRRLLSGGAIEPPGTTVRKERAARAGESVLRAEGSDLCWECHPKTAMELGDGNVHPPFAEGRCDSCHSPHASRYGKLARGETFDLCASCHPMRDQRSRPLHHVPFEQGSCTVCHEPHAAAEAGLLVREERVLCLGCHLDVAVQDGRGVKHDPFATGCTGCHEPHAGREQRLLAAARPDLCYGCHPRTSTEFASSSRHPVGGFAGSCNRCHEPHASDFPRILVTTERALCFGCHPEVRGEDSLPVAHGPFAQGCTGACHEPHGSETGPLLAAAKPGLCFGCHAGVRSEFDAFVRHRIEDFPGSCGECHEPHAARVAALLPVEQPALCFRCHRVIEASLGKAVRHEPFGGECTRDCHVPHGSPEVGLLSREEISLCYRCHPAVRASFDQASIHPLRPRSFPCSRCHDPHSAPARSLLAASGDAACYTGCHRAERKVLVSKHDESGCRGCHGYHGTRYSPIVLDSLPELCLRCHPDRGGNDEHPARPAWWDRLAKAPLTCSSSCHDPHGVEHRAMLRMPYGESGYGTDHLCLTCHRYAAPPGDRVGIDY